MDLRKYIAKNLVYLGISPKMKGYDYLKEAVCLCYMDDTMSRNLTKKLYPTIAEKFNTKSCDVERNIRSAIESAYRNGGLLNLNTYFNVIIYTQDRRLTNGEFIGIVLEKVKLELNEDTFKTHEKRI